MGKVKWNKEVVSIAILVIYVVATLCITLFKREPLDYDSIRTEWFWGYKTDNPKIFYGDNIYNILLFLPIGCMVGLIAPKHKLLAAVLVGLFLSETIECSQLIWHRGTFDVDDLFNNTIGVLLGGLIMVLTLWIRKKRNKE